MMAMNSVGSVRAQYIFDSVYFDPGWHLAPSMCNKPDLFTVGACMPDVQHRVPALDRAADTLSTRSVKTARTRVRLERSDIRCEHSFCHGASRASRMSILNQHGAPLLHVIHAPPLGPDNR